MVFGKFTKEGKISVLLVVLGVVVLGIPYFYMGLTTDDLGILFNTKISSWNDVFRIFTESCKHWHFTDYQNIKDNISAFNVWHRPLGMFLLGVQDFLWGNNAYGYYLVNVFFHSLNAALLFNLFLWFVGMPYALLGSLVFLFHGTVGKWIGIICTLQDILNLTFILAIIFFYRRFLSEKRFIYYLLSSLFFLAGLFNREVIIVLPICMFLYFVIFELPVVGLSWKYLKILVQRFYLFLIMMVLFAAVRIVLFGIEGGSGLFRLYALKDLLWSWLESTSDLIGFTFIKTANPKIKALVIIPFMSFLFYLFLKCKKKNVVAYLTLCIIILGWPFLLLSHHARYVYPCIPLFILALLFLMNYSVMMKVWNRRFMEAILVILVISGGIDSSLYLKDYEKLSSTAQKALVSLNDAKGNLGDRTLVFLGLPYRMYGSGISQGVKMFTSFKESKIYHVSDLDFVHKIGREKYGVDISKIDGGYRFVSGDASLAFWCSNPGIKEGDTYPIDGGKVVVNKKKGKYKTTDISLLVDQGHPFFSDKNAVFVVWDSKGEKFKVVETVCM